ncbi:tyrosine-type recombinase/integrase [Mycolicibacterium pulveris]|uniref:tyrosine-type recombinase/integrase n=1 Tax=Mycolicibacterium pulveris TaxID=36813 RepID=UPI003CEC7B4D
MVTLSDREGRPVLTGSLDVAEAWVGARFVCRPSGPAPLDIPKLWQPWLDLLVAELRAAKRSPQTINLRVQRLAAVAREIPGSDPRTVTRGDLIKYLGDHPEWTPEYAHSVRTSIRVFFALLDDLEARPNNPARRLPRIAIQRALPRPCPDGAIRAALDEVTDERVALAIRLGAEAGLRRMEIASLRRDAVEGWAGAFRIRVRGKGGHERIVPITDELAARLRADDTVYVFPSALGGHITARHLGKLVREALPDRWTAHTLRHRYATAAYTASGGDLRVVQELLGHVSPATTAIYTKITDESMRRAAIGAALD